MNVFRRGRGRRARLLTVVAGAAAIGGVASVGIALAAQRTPPQPPAATAQTPVVTNPSPSPSSSSSVDALPPPPSSAPTPGDMPAPTATPSIVGLPRSAPVEISIPEIGVHASFIQLGLNPDGSIQVPDDVTHVGWYRLGPAPGQVGPAVVLGHIDSAKSGPGVFFRLGALKSGDLVSITRADGRTVTFAVYAVREYPKDEFPTLTVYGNTNDSQLRLITCGGSFDHVTGHYRSNIVVFARQSR